MSAELSMKRNNLASTTTEGELNQAMKLPFPFETDEPGSRILRIFKSNNFLGVPTPAYTRSRTRAIPCPPPIHAAPT
jgi:hypothetical protein